MAKHDWKELYLDYQKNHEPSGASVSAYAKFKCLPSGSCRRAFKKLKDESDRIASDRLSGDREGTPEKKRSPKKKTTVKATASEGAKPKRSPARGKAVEVAKRADHFTRMKTGNTKAQSHGGYTTLAGIDNDVLDAVACMNDSGFESEKYLVSAQILHVERLANVNINKLIKEYDEDGPRIDENNREIPLERLISNIRFPSSEQVGRLSKILADIKDKEQKALRDSARLDMEQERHTHSPERMRTNQMLILKRRLDEGLTALETSRLLEVEGIPIPPLLMKEAEHEIRTAKPADDSQGLSEEELDAKEADYVQETIHYAEHVAPQHTAELLETLKQLEERGNVMADASDFDYEPTPEPVEESTGSTLEESTGKDESIAFGSEDLDSLVWSDDLNTNGEA